ncbi:hypothetical protein ASD06_02715 [Angustibacter sp. Root456]|nr:hypothetical protein ASD06_02715 [Angustibacter sp. Root456]
MVTLLAVLFLPGGAIAAVLGLRGLGAAAVAPLASAGVIATGGVVWAALGLRWSPWALLVCTVVGVGIAAAAAVATRRRGGRLAAAPDDAAPDDAARPVEPVAVLLGLGVAALLVGATYIHLTGTASAFPQQPDTIFHLSAPQWMLDHADISSLHANGYSTPSGTGFYPAGWHGIVVCAVQLSGAPIVVTSSALALITSAVVWPLGCMLLARLVVGPGPAVLLAAAVTSTAATALPFWLWGYGVLWPQLLGFCLLPAALSVGVLLLRPHLGPVRLLPAVVLALGCVAGLGLTHPSVAIALAGFAVPAVAERLAERGGRRGWLAAAAVVVVAAIGWLVVSSQAGHMRASNPPGPEVSLSGAIADAVLLAPRGAPHLWVLGAVVGVGAVVLLLRRGSRWLVVALAASAVLYVLIAGVDSPTTRWLTWPWYNNTPRLASLLAVPAVIAAAAGLSAMAAWLTRAGARARGGDGRAPAQRALLTWAPTLLLTGAFLVVTGGGYVRSHLAVDRPYFEPSVDRSWVSPQELDALRELAREIPPQAVVAANPWNGGTYLYPVSGRRLLVPTEKSPIDADRALLVKHLADAGDVPGVCAAAQRLHVQYALTGGRPWAKRSQSAWRNYSGIDRVPESPAFTKVATSAPYTLWKLTGCSS